jgi:hypothetical protein
MRAVWMLARSELRRRWRSVVVLTLLVAFVGAYFWRRVADELGVASDPAWPVLGIVVLAVAAFLAVNLIAAVPARRAASTRPAVVLRSE